MADDEVRVRIKVSGGMTAEPLLKKAMADEGVQWIASSRDDPPILNSWASVAQAGLNDLTDLVIVVGGTKVAVRKGLERFRNWHAGGEVVEVQDDESGDKLEGYL